MALPAAYDEIADWYEQQFLAGIAAPGADRLGIDAALGSLLGRGTARRRRRAHPDHAGRPRTHP